MTGKKLGRYEIIRTLGKGAMGLVYEGHDPVLQRHVAIKTIIVEKLDAKAAEEYEFRFRTEALAAARLLHPNIVPVFDFGRDEEVAYLVMQFIDGDDLKHHLDNGEHFSPAMVVSMVLDLLAALDHAHENNIVHRDIKPANMLIEKGRVKLTDFGVARIQDPDAANRTQVGAAGIGTPRYMSPEQAQGQRVDARSDLFSAGVVLYELLTGVRPFDGDNPFAVIHQIVNTLPPPPTYHNPKLPRAIDAVVAKALAKNRDERFSSAREFALALKSAGQRVIGTAGTPAPPPPPPPPPQRAQEQTGGSSINLELELEYWKDIKDSDDVDDFVNFLDSFPTGKFAALAQRRLKKLGYDPDASSKGTGHTTDIGADDETRLPGMPPTIPPSAASSTGIGMGATGPVIAASTAAVISPEALRVIEEARQGTAAGRPQEVAAELTDAQRQAEARRLDDESLQREAEHKRQAAEERRRREETRRETEVREAEARQKAEAREAEAKQKAAEEAKRQEEARRQAAEAEARRVEQEQREAEARRQAEEAKRQEEARRQAAEAEARRTEQEKREAEAKRQAEEAKRQEEARRQAAEAEARRIEKEQREAEAKRKAEEAKRQAEEAKRAEAEKRAAEKLEAEKREAEAKRKAEEAKRLEAEKREAEAKRKAEESRRLEADRREAEARRKADEEAKKREAEARRQAEAAKLQEDLRRMQEAKAAEEAKKREAEQARKAAEDARRAAAEAARLQPNTTVPADLGSDPLRTFDQPAASRPAVATPSVARATARDDEDDEEQVKPKSKMVPMAIAGVVALAAVGAGVMMMGKKDPEVVAKAPTEAPQPASPALTSTPELPKPAAPATVAPKAPPAPPAATLPPAPVPATKAPVPPPVDARPDPKEAEAKRKAEEAKRLEDAKRQQEQAAAAKKQQEEAAKKQQEEAARQQQQQQQQEAARRQQEEAARQQQEAARRQQEEAAKKQQEEAAAAARRQQEEAAAAARRQQEEAARRAAAPPPAEQVARATVSASQLMSQAREAESGGRVPEAVSLYKQASGAGSGAAAKRLWEIYTNGAGGVGRDAQQAATYGKIAADRGENIPQAVRLR